MLIKRFKTFYKKFLYRRNPLSVSFARYIISISRQARPEMKDIHDEIDNLLKEFESDGINFIDMQSMIDILRTIEEKAIAADK